MVLFVRQCQKNKTVEVALFMINIVKEQTRSICK